MTSTTKKFQSTCPARGTTLPRSRSSTKHKISIHVPREGHDSSGLRCRQTHPYFNPRAPRGARLQCHSVLFQLLQISIHVPREGHDRKIYWRVCCRRISIHVPREGHDLSLQKFFPRVGRADFNPRAPRGARPQDILTARARMSGFQSTCPARGTTCVRL